MSTDLFVAYIKLIGEIISVIVAIIGVLAIVLKITLTLIDHFLKERIESPIVQTDRERISIEKDNIKSDLQGKFKQTDSLKYKTVKHQIEQDRLKKLSDQRKVEYLINIFEQSSITSISYLDPLDIFRSIRKTRSLLDEHEIFSFNDKELEECIRDIKMLIQEIEVQVKNRCPQIGELVREIENQSLTAESGRLKQLSELSNQMNCSEVIKFMLEKHDEIQRHIQKIQTRSHELSSQ